MLRGEPDTGKSRLLKGPRRQHMTVLTATGFQAEARLPFSGLHQLLRPVRARAENLPLPLRTARCAQAVRGAALQQLVRGRDLVKWESSCDQGGGCC